MSFKIVFLLNICCSFLFSQSANYRIREYGSHVGLSQSVVNCVIQDSKGFIWAGTQDGLNRFDGYSFKVYKPDIEDSTSISHNHIWIIFEDSKKNLWLGTYGGGLNFYDYNNDKFFHFKHSLNNPNSINGDDVRAIYEDGNGILWIGTKNGLNSFDPIKKKWTDYSIDSNSSVPFKNIRDIYPHSDSELWLACYGSGLVLFNKETGKSTLFNLSDSETGSISSNKVWKIIKDKKGIYWVITFGGGVNIFDSHNSTVTGKISFEKFHQSEIDKNLTAIFETDDGEIFIGSDTQGMVIVDRSRKNLTHIKYDVSNPNSLSNNGVWSFCKNNSGGYWIGTFGGGLNFFQSGGISFEHITTNKGKPLLNNPIVFSINKISKSEYVVGTYGGGISIVNRTTGNAKYFTESNSKISSNYITSVVIENSSSYWFGTDGSGVSHYNPVENLFVNYNSINNEKLPNDFVKCMLIDSYNNIWVGTLQGLCNIQNPEKVEPKFYSDKVFKYDIRELLEIEPGIILIGTHGLGIFIHDVRKKTFEKIKNELIENQQITALFKDINNTLWIGTRGHGLIKYDLLKNHAKLFTEKNGLSNNTVLGIEKDNYKNLWVTTNNGISKFDTNNFLFTNYFEIDGLLSNEFVQGAILKDEMGVIYAGSIKGIEIIHPEKFAVNKFNPSIEISKLTIMDEEKPLVEIADSKLVLSFRENFIKIDFTSIDFTKPEKNLYRYKLSPGNSDWINLGTLHSVNFANLAPGKYFLELNGTNSDGIWSKNVRSLTIIIKPPFYNTFWFYSLLVLIIGFVVYRFYYLRIQKRLEMEKLRLKIASDLHDEVGSSLSQISINADMINYETNFEKIKSKSEFIRMKSGEMISTMNDVIWSIDSRNDNLINLVDRIKTTSLQFASSKNIKMDIDIRIENNERKLNVDFRQNLFLIIKEAVNNSIKHSGANCIELKFYEKNGQIKIIISDNGSGLPPSLKETGNGLKNIIHRSEKIKGKLEFINSNGLRIELEVNIT